MRAVMWWICGVCLMVRRLVFTGLPPEITASYAFLKKDLLTGFDMTPNGYWAELRSAKQSKLCKFGAYSAHHM